MKRTAPSDHLWMFLLLAGIAYLSGCTATKPNIPHKGPYPSTFNNLSANNPLLFQEIAKLPEIQDGISDSEAKVLKRISELYAKDPEIFDSAFTQMYQVGIPEVRKYCSPLQAIFWLAEDNEADTITLVIQKYSLKTLLDKAWKFYETSDTEENKLTTIINGIKSEVRRQDYAARNRRLPLGMFKSEIISAYKKNRFYFTKEARAAIETLIDRRWDDFDEVTERLNAPELIDYYERKLFRYVIPPLNKPIVSARYVFKHNEGACGSITRFTIYGLHKAGYSAKRLELPGHNAPYHVVCLFQMNGEKYVMDNGRPRPLGIFPYKAITGQ